VKDLYRNQAVFQCPSFPRAAPASGLGLHYAMNNVDFENFREHFNYGPANRRTITSVPGDPSQVAFLVELSTTVQDYVHYDVWKPEHATFNRRGAPNFDPRMIKSDDRRHNGNTTLSFLDAHAEIRRIAKENLPWRLFNPLEP